MLIERASDFWDHHDFTQFADTEEVKEVQFKLKKKYVGIDNGLYEIIKKQAKKLRIDEDNLVLPQNMWVKKNQFQAVS